MTRKQPLGGPHREPHLSPAGVVPGAARQLQLDLGSTPLFQVLFALQKEMFTTLAREASAVPIDDEPEAGPEPESEFNLAEYLGMLRRHWKLAAVCCLAALVVAVMVPMQIAGAYATFATSASASAPAGGS